MATPTPSFSQNQVPGFRYYVGTGGTVLIFGDSEKWRIRVRQILEKQPECHIVAEACDGVQAVQIATDVRPQIVLLDIGMPVMNGLDAADRIRSVSPTSKMVFVI